MALHHELPIHRTGTSLLALALKVQEQMPRSMKRSLGEKITQHCVDMLDLMALANASKQRVLWLRPCACRWRRSWSASPSLPTSGQQPSPSHPPNSPLAPDARDIAPQQDITMNSADHRGVAAINELETNEQTGHSVSSVVGHGANVDPAAAPKDTPADGRFFVLTASTETAKVERSAFEAWRSHHASHVIGHTPYAWEVFQAGWNAGHAHALEEIGAGGVGDVAPVRAVLSSRPVLSDLSDGQIVNMIDEEGRGFACEFISSAPVVGMDAAINAIRAALSSAPAREPPGKNWHAHHVAVNKAALQMVRNALRTDAEAGKTVRGEMLEELDKATFAIPAPAREPMSEEAKAWARLGPLIDKHHIGISTPESRVHRYGGNNQGWGLAGCWGGTAWLHGLERRPVSHSKSGALEVVEDLAAQIQAGICKE